MIGLRGDDSHNLRGVLGEDGDGLNDEEEDAKGRVEQRMVAER
jgi:hypothetical protein